MPTFTVTLPSGVEWTPTFVVAIDKDKCIGCCRCFKVCQRQVLRLRGLTEDGEFVDIDGDDEDEDEYERKVMTVARVSDCVGCRSCLSVCTRKCLSHEVAETAETTGVAG